MRDVYFYLILTVSVIPLSARADLYQCNGVWTNKPCEGSLANLMKEDALDPRATDEEYKAKREILREASEFQVRIRERGVEFQLADLEKFCFSEEEHRTPPDCRSMYTALRQKALIQAKANDEQRFKEKLANDLKETKETAEEAKVAAEEARDEVRKTRLENQYYHGGKRTPQAGMKEILPGVEINSGQRVMEEE